MSGRFPILFVAEADPGAALLSSGLLARLVDEIPQASFTIVGGPLSAPLFRDTPRLEKLLVLERDTKGDWLKLWNAVRARRWGLVVDLRGSKLSDRLHRQRRAVRKPPAKDAPHEHAVLSAARVLTLEDDAPAPRLFFDADTRAVADAVLGVGPEPILAVGPGVEWVGRRWPSERFTKVAAALLADDGPMAGGRLLIVGTEAERDAAHTIRLAVPRDRVIEAQGKLDWLGTAAALSRASLFLGADSIWTQLAVAAGVPSVGVFGPSDETNHGPWRGRSVRGPRQLHDYLSVDPRLDQAINHMMDLPWEPVLAAALELLDERAPVPEEDEREDEAAQDPGEAADPADG